MENNRVYLLGRLCHAPKLFQTRSQRPKMVFRLAIPRMLPATRPASAGRQNTRPDSRHIADFITVVVLGTPANELNRRHLEKGMWVQVAGWLRSWDRPSLRTNGVLEVVAEQVQVGGEQQ